MARRRIKIFTEKISLPWEGITESFLGRMTKAVCDELKLDRVAISLIICDDEYIRGINKKYRKKNRPTDVISFAYREEPFPGMDAGMEELGDIYISAHTALAQSVELEVTLKDEFRRLLIHGMLHLVGYDHEISEKEARKMERKEESILRAISKRGSR